MSERGPEGRKGKFNNSRDACLYHLTVSGWANESNGDVASPQGFFSKVVIVPAELDEIVEAFREEFTAEGLVDHGWLVGNFLLLEDEAGFVNVNEYFSKSELDHDFLILEEAFTAWLEGQGEQ